MLSGCSFFQRAKDHQNNSVVVANSKRERNSIVKMPTPMVIKFAKLVIAIASIAILGTVIGIALKDQTLLYLSGGVALAGSVKAIDYFRTYKEGRFESVEGILLQERVILGRKRHSVVLQQDDTEQVQLLLEGRFHLQVGSKYRFYLKKDAIHTEQLKLPEVLQPAQIVLGYEKLSFSSGKQI